ncbi:MAG TPA: hypothetical protein VIC85_06910 [Ktedonobacterales bacterium]
MRPALRLAPRPPAPEAAPDGAAASGASGPSKMLWSLARWRRESTRLIPFVPVVLLLESANWYLLNTAFAWVLPVSALAALAAAALLIALFAIVFSSVVVAQPELRRDQLRLRLTLTGIVALQVAANTIVGFGVARTHMPASAALFFGWDPIVMARVVSVVLGGSLALITFFCLGLVIRVVDRLFSPVDPIKEANTVLNQRDGADPVARPVVPAPTGGGPSPTVVIRGMVPVLGPDTGNADTVGDPRMFGGQPTGLAGN